MTTQEIIDAQWKVLAKQARKALRAAGVKQPKMGYCVTLGNGVEVCRDARGLFTVGIERAVTR